MDIEKNKTQKTASNNHTPSYKMCEKPQPCLQLHSSVIFYSKNISQSLNGWIFEDHHGVLISVTYFIQSQFKQHIALH